LIFFISLLDSFFFAFGRSLTLIRFVAALALDFCVTSVFSFLLQTQAGNTKPFNRGGFWRPFYSQWRSCQLRSSFDRSSPFELLG